MKRLLSDIHVLIITLLCGLFLIEWSIHLIAPFNVLRRVDELNGLMILSDPSLQSSHELFRLLALIVDFGLTLTTLIRMMNPFFNVSTLITMLLWWLGLTHSSKVFSKAKWILLSLLVGYMLVLLVITASIGLAFVSNSPQNVLMLINQAGSVGVFGGIILCFLTIISMTTIIVSGVRQK